MVRWELFVRLCRHLQYGLHSAVHKLKLGHSVIDCMLLLAQEMESQRATMSASINLILMWLNGAITNSGLHITCSGIFSSGWVTAIVVKESHEQYCCTGQCASWQQCMLKPCCLVSPCSICACECDTPDWLCTVFVQLRHFKDAIMGSCLQWWGEHGYMQPTVATFASLKPGFRW